MPYPVMGKRVTGGCPDSASSNQKGSIISAMIVNICLHYVLDLWFHMKWRAHIDEGKAVIIGYADDFVVGPQHKRDAECFLIEPEERLAAFGLKPHPKKTRMIEFGRFTEANQKRRGLKRPETFDFRISGITAG